MNMKNQYVMAMTLLSGFLVSGMAHAQRTDDYMEFHGKRPADTGYAKTEVTDDLLLSICRKTPDRCKFVVEDKTALWSRKQVGKGLPNCNSSVAGNHVSQEETTGGSDSVETSVTVGTSDELIKLISISVTQTYGHSWEWSHTDAATQDMNVDPLHFGYFLLETPMEEVSGHYIVRFPNKFPIDSPEGKNEWRAPLQGTVKAKGVSIQPNRTPRVRPLQRPLTPEELAECKEVETNFPVLVAQNAEDSQPQKAFMGTIPPVPETYVASDPRTGLPVD